MAMFRSFGLSSSIWLPSTQISPVSISSRPAMARSRVDFPHPEGPTSATNSPDWISRSKLGITVSSPKLFLIFLSSREAISIFPAARTRRA